MLEEGSKPHGADSKAAEAALPRLAGLKSTWLPIAGALLAALALAVLILLAAQRNYGPILWPQLERNYWLVAALSVLVCLGLGKDVQRAGALDVAAFRVSGRLILALGADAGLAAGILCGADRGTAWNLESGLAGFFLANGIVAAGLLGRRLVAGGRHRISAPQSAAVANAIVGPGMLVPFDGIVISGRSEIDDGPIGGSALGAIKLAGDTVRRGARNGDGSLTIEPLVEPPLVEPDYPPARVFAASLHARARLVFAAMLALALVIAVWRGETLPARAIVGLLVLAVATPFSLGLVRPLIYAKAERLAKGMGWHLNGTAALEALAEASAIAFGRAGIVTRTELEVAALHPAVGIEAAELIAAATSVAQSSESVWAKTLLRYAVTRKLRLAPIVEWSDELLEIGFGLTARTQGGQVLVAGSRAWLAGQGIRTHLLEAQERESLSAGRRSLWVAQIEPAPILIGVIIAGERLKPGASEMCKNAKRFGLVGALMDRRDMEGGAELARYLGLRLVEDDILARKAMETEWTTAGLRPVIVQHRGDPLPVAPDGPRLLMGARFDRQDGLAVAGGWSAATEREDPRLILDLLRIARETQRREKLGLLLAYVFSVPGLWLLASGRSSAAILVAAALIGLIGVIVNAQLLGLVSSTATEIDEE
ncbi:MAG TPA: hypothetical protein VMW18_01125 [Candidatus Binatia bacterium]|nr:hypothetical protein [Candidatus Binatia bacterium]